MNRRRTILAAAAVLLGVYFCERLVDNRYHARNHAREVAKRRAATAALLDQRLSHLSFDDAPLGPVLDTIAQHAGLRLSIDWAALERRGVTPESPVSARVRNIRAGKALTIVLDSVSQARPLEFAVDDAGRACIPAPSGASIAVWEVYDVSDFLEPLTGDAPMESELAEQIRSLVIETVEPDTWVGRRDGFAVCQSFDRKLLVLQTPEGHDQLGGLLDQLRESLRRRELNRLFRRLQGRGAP